MNAVLEKTKRVNGIDLDALSSVVAEISANPAAGKVGFRVNTEWRGQTRSRSTIRSFSLGGQDIARHFTVDADEPEELLGTNTAPNPQELLMSALNACIMVGYVAGAASKGITLESVEIETTGSLDLRGFLGIDPTVPPGYETLHYVVRMKGNGTAEQYREIHENVMRTSPNFFNLSRPIRIDARLEIGK